MSITHGSKDMSKLWGYSLGKKPGASTGDEVQTERGSTDGCNIEYGDGNPRTTEWGIHWVLDSGYSSVRLIT